MAICSVWQTSPVLDHMLFKSTLCKSRENLPTDSNADKVAYKNTTNTDENSYVRTTKEQSE